MLEIVDIGGDVLLVREWSEPAKKEDKPTLLNSATGWVSAIENHYDDSAYGQDGHLPTDDEGNVTARSRRMTDDEIRAYAARLLNEQVPSSEPKTLLKA